MLKCCFSVESLEWHQVAVHVQIPPCFTLRMQDPEIGSIEGLDVALLSSTYLHFSTSTSAPFALLISTSVRML